MHVWQYGLGRYQYSLSVYYHKNLKSWMRQKGAGQEQEKGKEEEEEVNS